MASRPLLTVVVPAYGVQHWLDECLESVLGQDVDVEVVVVVDASPDRTGRVAQEWAARDGRVVVVENPANVGLGASRNVGLDRARGRYVTFVDSDDVVPAGHHRAVLDVLERTGSDLATAPADEFGGPVGRRRYWTTRHAVFDRGAERTTLAEHPGLVADHTAWTKVFRRDFLRRHGIRWAQGTTCEDVAASTAAYARAEAVDVVPRCGYLYRRRHGSLSTGLVSPRAVADWAAQTGAALAALRDGGAPAAAVVELARKVLHVEAAARARAVRDGGGRDDGAVDALRRLLDDLLGAAGEAAPALLEEVDVGTLRTLRDVAAPDGTAGRLLAAALAPPPERPAAATGASVGTGSPAVSVVIPTRDVAPWIDDCLDSVLGQDVDLEAVVVDDASTDGTWETVLRRAASDPRVVALRNPGAGGAQARNAGVAAARGTYLTFCDGDDAVAPGGYAALASALRRTGADVAVGGYLRVAPDSVWRATGYGVDGEAAVTTLRLRPALVRGRTCWNRMVRLDWWRARRLRFPTAVRANDILPMTAAAARAERIAVVPDVVYQYRARPGGTSMTARTGAWRSLAAYLAQERLCAVELSRPAADRVTSEYWSAVLTADAWTAVTAYLAAGARDADAEADTAVAGALRELLDLAPRSALDAAGPRRRAVYALVAAGRPRQAADLAAAPDPAAPAAEAVRRLDAVAAASRAQGLDDAAVTDLLRTDALGVLLAADPCPDGVLADVRAGVRRLAAGRPVAGAGTPGTREPRLLAALLDDDGDAARTEARGGRAPVAARVVRAEGRRVRLRGAPAGAGEPRHVELVGTRPGTRETTVRRAVGTVAGGSDGWAADLDLGDVPPGVDWRARLVVSDGYGRDTVDVRLAWDAPTSRVAAVRPTGDAGAVRLRVFEPGTARLRRAVEWRVERLRRTRGGAR